MEATPTLTISQTQGSCCLDHTAHTHSCCSSCQASDVSAGGCPRVLRHQCALCVSAVPHPRSAARAHVRVQAGAQVGAAVAVAQEHSFAGPGPMPVRHSSSDAQLATSSRRCSGREGCILAAAFSTRPEPPQWSQCCSQSIHGTQFLDMASATPGS